MNYEIPENPIFTEEIKQLEPTDRAHASLFNNIFVKLFQNNIFNRKKQAEHETNKNNPHLVKPSQIGAATVDALDLAYQNGNEYTDRKIADLINGAPSTMDTLKEISDTMSTNKSVVDALEASIGSKAPKDEFDTHAASKTVHITAAERTKWNTVDTTLSPTSKNPVQNKTIKEAIDSQNVIFANSVSDINQSLNTVSFDPQSDGLYANYKVGADSVRKKLGSTVRLLATSVQNGTFNVTDIAGYEIFTKENFFTKITQVQVKGGCGNGGWTPLLNFYPTISYNASMGQVTLANMRYDDLYTDGNGHISYASGYIYVNLYCIY